jgi:DNA polymerase bacteriophage-type
MKYNVKDLITLDFETYFATDYSLRNKRHNQSSYIRDPQFEAQICSIKEGRKPAKCFTGASLIKKLKSIDWANKDLLCHHAHFDGAILAWHYGIKPRMYFDTLCMSRALHAEYASKSLGEIGKLYELGGKYEDGEVLDKVKGKRIAEIMQDKELYDKFCQYCDRDVELTFDIFMKQIEVFPEDEARLIDLTVRMFVDPVFKLDVPRCEIALDEATRERQIGIAVGLHAAGLASEKDLTSNIKFVAALKKLGVEAPTKKSKYNGEITYALSENDEDFVALLEHENRNVVRLVQGRLAAKSTISETRAARLLEAGANDQGVPVYLNYYGAKTGRWSGGNKLNFQNFPRGSELRKSIIAPQGHVVVVADSSQIEARVVNWVSNNEEMLHVFATKGDPYCHTATSIYGRTISKADKDERFIGKIATLGLGYGMGAAKFQTTLALGTMGPAVDMPLNECDKIVRKFRKANEAITKYWRAMDGVLARMSEKKSGEYGTLTYDEDGIWLPNGMGILYPGLTVEHGERGPQYKYWSKTKWSKLYGGLVTENVVQALAGVIIREQMRWVADYLAKLKLKTGERAQIATMTHDEIVCVVPKRLGEPTLKHLINLMSTSPSWCPDLPLGAEGGVAENYSK